MCLPNGIFKHDLMIHKSDADTTVCVMELQITFSLV